MLICHSVLLDQHDLTDGRPGGGDDGNVVGHDGGEGRVFARETMSKVHLPLADVTTRFMH